VRLQHVALGIAHDGAEKARHFYSGLLGLEERELPEGVDPALFIWFRLGDADLELHLHLLDEADPPPVRAHFCLVVGDDLDELRARLTAGGVATRDPRFWANRGAFFCHDPFDNLIEISRQAHS
jgi:catechol 2,3-dioxygenase-like lactoylglutathione lyase family enzyme